MAVLEVIMAIFAVIEMVARSGWEPAATWPEEMFALTGMQLPDRRMLQYAGRMATAGTMPKKNQDKKKKHERRRTRNQAPACSPTRPSYNGLTCSAPSSWRRREHCRVPLRSATPALPPLAPGRVKLKMCDNDIVRDNTSETTSETKLTPDILELRPVDDAPHCTAVPMRNRRRDTRVGLVMMEVAFGISHNFVLHKRYSFAAETTLWFSTVPHALVGT